MCAGVCLCGVGVGGQGWGLMLNMFTKHTVVTPCMPQCLGDVCRPDGAKKAYVRLTPDYDALDVANKIGII